MHIKKEWVENKITQKTNDHLTIQAKDIFAIV